MRVKIRRRRARQRCDAFQPSPSGCGARRPSPAPLLLDVLQGVRHRRRSLDLAAWRTQRGSREILKPALKIILATALLATPAASAATYDLKEHTPEVQAALAGRQARYAQLTTAKTQGLVGESNQGLVSQRGGGADVAALVQAENRDRMVIYQAIVQQNGLPAEALSTVQQVFAQTQRERASPGDPIQLPSGEWATK